MTVRYFAVVVGSGFSGSLIAWILQRQGKDVLLIDRQSHPRFAIGESSTPTADFLLAYLADRWNLPSLGPLASWGSWQATYPHLGCGKKRGFSYFGHRRNETFEDDLQHRRSLLVAASDEEYTSDTHWLRSDVDAFLCEQAKNQGVLYHDHCEVIDAHRDQATKLWRVQCQSKRVGPIQVESSWLIDATGNGTALAAWTDSYDDSQWMRTHTGSLFAHFRGVGAFGNGSANPSQDFNQPEPFHGDDAAQHHVIENGWFWMLRFSQGVTSVGVVKPTEDWRKELGVDSGSPGNRRAVWERIISDYPSVQALLKDACIDETGGPLRFAERLSRCQSKAAGRGWLSLPTTYGFVDPLHSTGIAHALSGVSRVAEMLLGGDVSDELLRQYDSDLRCEVDWLDTLVSGSYQMLPSFEGFISYAAFYFISAIEFEKDLMVDPSSWPKGFLHCRNQSLRGVAQSHWNRGDREFSECDVELWVHRLRHSIVPWNRVGLLDPANKNRIPHTVPRRLPGNFARR